jgi:hypothetical protein
MSTVNVIRLKTGEDLIAFVESSDMNSGYITIKDPFHIFMPQPGRIAILPFIPFCDIGDGLKLDASDIMWKCQAEKEVEAQYRSTISQQRNEAAGLVVPPKGLVVPGGVSNAAGKASSLKLST